MTLFDMSLKIEIIQLQIVFFPSDCSHSNALLCFSTDGRYTMYTVIKLNGPRRERDDPREDGKRIQQDRVHRGKVAGGTRSDGY